MPKVSEINTLDAIKADSHSTCCICFEIKPESDIFFSICGSNGCTNGFCKMCLKIHFTSIISSGFDGSCPQMKCPECVRRIVPRPIWETFVEPEATKKFKERASKLLSLECAVCHYRRTLFLESTRGLTYKEKIQEMRDIIQGLANKPKIEDEIHKQEVINYEFQVSDIVDEMMTQLYLFECNDINEQDVFDPIQLALKIDDSNESFEHFTKLLEMIQDEERRSMLHLRYLHFYPQVKSPCCSSIHCFWCKIKDFHDGMSCAEYRSTLNTTDDIVLCPACNLSIVRGDGCDAIRCLCGHRFSWNSMTRQQKATIFHSMFGPAAPRKAVEILKLETVQVDEVTRSYAEIFSIVEPQKFKKALCEIWEQVFRTSPVQAAISFPSILATNSFRSNWPKPEIFFELRAEWVNQNFKKFCTADSVNKSIMTNSTRIYFNGEEIENIMMLFNGKYISNFFPELRVNENNINRYIPNLIICKKSQQFIGIYGICQFSIEAKHHIHRKSFTKEQVLSATRKAILFSANIENISQNHKHLLDAFIQIYSYEIHQMKILKVPGTEQETCNITTQFDPLFGDY